MSRDLGLAVGSTDAGYSRAVTSALLRTLIEPEHIAYVTNDLVEARRIFARLGAGPFETIEPELDFGASAPGSKVPLTASFASFGGRRLELVEPRANDRTSIFGAPLADCTGFALRFHHLGARLSDLRPLRAAAEAEGFRALSAAIGQVRPGGTVLFVDLTALLGHWLEGVRLDPAR